MFAKEDFGGFFLSCWDHVEGNSKEKASFAICMRSLDRMSGLKIHPKTTSFQGYKSPILCPFWGICMLEKKSQRYILVF